MIPSVVALAAHLSRERAKQQDADAALAAAVERARLQMLQMQLQPRFLVRSLRAIARLMPTDSAAACAMLAALGDLLRVSLERMNVPEVPLRDELALLSKYLDFQRPRFRERLVVRTDVAMDTMEARVPTFLLQPLVENAIHYTVERTSRTATVQVIATRAGDELHVDVRDDGPAFSSYAQRRKSGAAIVLTRRRLEQLHGTRQRIELLDANGSGALVRVVMPFRTAEAA